MAWFEDGEWVLMPGEVEPRRTEMDDLIEVWFDGNATEDDIEIDEDVFDDIYDEYEEGME